MLRRSLIVTFGFLGALLIGTAAGTAPASAGYACGPWNGWCGPKLWIYPGYSFGWYGHGHNHGHDKWGKAHSPTSTGTKASTTPTRARTGRSTTRLREPAT
jgi:hypothetical protein